MPFLFTSYEGEESMLRFFRCTDPLKHWTSKLYYGTHPYSDNPGTEFAFYIHARKIWILFSPITSIGDIMSDNPFAQWRSIPAFNYQFQELGLAVDLCVDEFKNRAHEVFLILQSYRTSFWLVIPWSQYRKLDDNHPAHQTNIIFRGTLKDLRTLAKHFPPDLFDAELSRPSDNGTGNTAPKTGDEGAGS